MKHIIKCAVWRSALKRREICPSERESVRMTCKAWDLVGLEVLDLLASELGHRFDQESFKVLRELEKLLIESCNGIPVQPSVNTQEMYASDVNFNNLKVQLLMLPDLLHTATKEHQLGIKKVTSISTLCQVFNSCNCGKTMLNEVHQLVRIYLTVPMTTATAERNFSTLRRLKNYLRSTMTQKRLTHIVLLHTHMQASYRWTLPYWSGKWLQWCKKPPQSLLW